MHISFTPDAPAMPEVSFDDFLAVDIRIGTILEAAPLEGARKPSIKMVIDFGDTIGTKKSAAQITEHYAPEALVGRQVMGVVNFPPRQIGKFMSQALTLGFADADGAIRLIRPDAVIPNGTRMS
ncbi:MAG: tRNA-binding protein [Pseudomonadota bacterium]